MWLEKKNVQTREEMLMVKVVKIELMEKKEEEEVEEEKKEEEEEEEEEEKERASLRGEGPKGPSHYHLCDIEFHRSVIRVSDYLLVEPATADSYTRRRPQVPANKRSVDDLAHILYYGASLARPDRLLCSPLTPPTLGITITTYST
ncbi:hypothetical protein HZH68_010370 [Vespula germanica]|uniref:Uncharacterized protein n=1 Tax=Vespula germanica TaxID=30212 RepID=A0A834JTX8_VESGE|nr:hypothetical protein HZH68_010370 [Vespula germanica]